MSTAPTLTLLRQGSATDLAAVAPVMEAAFDPRHGEAWTSAQCLGMLALPGVWLTLAEAGDGVVVGFSLSRVTVDEAELLLIAVDPAHRRQGVGSALLRGVIADAQTRGAKRLHLEVRADNPAVALYRAYRFTKVGERREYYRGSDGRRRDAHSYALPL